MRIGIVGAGNIGGTLAKRLAERGHDVLVANSSGTESLAPLIEEIGANAEAATPEEAVAGAEVVVIAVPFKSLSAVPTEGLDGKVVVDATNYYPDRDGHDDALDKGVTTSSEVSARHFGHSRLIKAFNTLYYENLRDDGLPSGSADRKVIALSGDDGAAKVAVALLIDEMGFDPLDLGTLAVGGRRQQPGSPIYNRVLTRAQAQAALA